MLPLTFCITYTSMKNYYPGEPVDIHIQSLIHIIQESNWVITTKKGKGKLPLFFGNVERVIPIYGSLLLFPSCVYQSSLDYGRRTLVGLHDES